MARQLNPPGLSSYARSRLLRLLPGNLVRLRSSCPCSLERCPTLPRTTPTLQPWWNVHLGTRRTIVAWMAGTVPARMRSKCRYFAREQMETQKHTVVFVAKVLSCSGIGNRTLNELPQSTKFRRRSAVITATRKAPRRTRKRASWFPSGAAQTLSPEMQFPAVRQPGIFRIFPRLLLKDVSCRSHAPPRRHREDRGCGSDVVISLAASTMPSRSAQAACVTALNAVFRRMNQS